MSDIYFQVASLASVAQLVEHPTDTRAVEGSTPSACTIVRKEKVTSTDVTFSLYRASFAPYTYTNA
jgi:hypothetical protein